MRLKSYAKINLYLNLITKNEQGYHLLDSLFSYVDLYDEIEISEHKAQDHEIEADYPLATKSNLIYKALELFLNKYKLRQKFKVIHKKNIPMGAGLGGGSSNAAVILGYLYDHFGIDESLDNKIDLAKSLGADVPFFLTNKTKYISGIGEVMGNDCEICELPIILIKPVEGLETKKVFSNIVKQDFTGALSKHPNNLQNPKEFWSFLKENNNDLLEAALKSSEEFFSLYSMLRPIDKALCKMTGSGSTCFLLCKDEDSCDELFSGLEAKFPNYFIKKSRLLSKV